MWQPLPWDSDFFGLRIARLQPSRLEAEPFAQALAELHEWQADLVYALLDSQEDTSIFLVERHGFHLVDVRITLECDLKTLTAHNAAIDQQPGVRLYQEADRPALQQIAATAFHDTRFYADRRIPQERANALYVTWITQSCLSPDEQVFVAELNGQVAGFISCKSNKPSAEAQIGLVAVAPGMHGRGLGGALVHAAQAWARDEGLEWLTVVTQGRNIQAQRLYQSRRFFTLQFQFWYHKWFSIDHITLLNDGAITA